MQYKKVLHPFDLDLTSLAILRKAFEKAEQDSNSKGISLDNLTHLMVKTLNVDLNYAHTLLRNFDKDTHQKIMWRDFLDFLEKEGKLREDIIDLKLYDLSLKRFQEVRKFEIRNQGITLLDTNAMMEIIVQFEVNRKIFNLVFFDDGQIFLFNKSLKYIEAFFPLDKHPKEFPSMETWEYRPTMGDPASRVSKNNVESKIGSRAAVGTIPSRNTIEEKRIRGSHDVRSKFANYIRQATKISGLSNLSMDQDNTIEEDSELNCSKGFKIKKLVNHSFDHTRVKNSVLRVSAVSNNSSIKPEPPSDKDLDKKGTQKRNFLEVARMSTTISRDTSLLSIRKKESAVEQETNVKDISFSEKLENMMKEFPQVERISSNEQESIHYIFEQFKKAPVDRCGEIANIGYWAYQNKDYNRAKQFIEKAPRIHRAETSLLNLLNAKRENKKQVAQVVQKVPECISINELKEKFSKVKDQLSTFESMQDRKNLEKLIEKREYSKVYESTSRKSQQEKKIVIQPSTSVPPVSTNSNGSGSHGTKKFSIYEKYLMIKSKVFATNSLFHPETGLLAIAFLNRELRVYSPRYKFEDFLFLEKHHLKFSSIPMFLVFNMHQAIKHYVMAVVTEDTLYILKIDKKNKEFYIEKDPIFKATAPHYMIKEPAGVRFCQSIGLIVIGVGGEAEIYAETNSESGFYKRKRAFTIRFKVPNQAITITTYSNEFKMLAVGTSKGGVSTVDPLNGVTKATYTYDNVPVARLHFISSEKTLVAIYQDKTMVLLNAETMQVLQVMKDRDVHRPHNIIKTSLYDPNREVLIIAGSHAKAYKLQQDPGVELVKRETEMRRCFAPQTYGKSLKAFNDYKYLFSGIKKTDFQAKDIFKVFYVGSEAESNYSECLFIVEKTKSLKIYDLKQGKFKFAFFIGLEGQIISAAVSKDGKFLAITGENGLVKLFNTRSGECIEELFHSKADIQVLSFLPKENSHMIAAGKSDGELLLFSSAYKITKEKKVHENVVAHLNCITALDMNSEYIATADEVKEVKIWSVYNFQYLFTVRIPSEYDPNACFEFADGSNPHQAFRGEASIIELRFIQNHNREPLVLVLESRGCLHIINPKEGKLVQLHAANIGQYACFDVEYDPLGLRLYSFDIDLNIRILFTIENTELEDYKSQATSQLNFERAGSAKISKNVSFAADDSPIDSPGLASPFDNGSASPSARRNPRSRTALPTNTRRRNKAMVKINASDEELSQSTVGSEKVGWAFYLIKKIKLSNDLIPRGIDAKNLQIMYVPCKSIFITVISHGDILMWKRSGEYDGKLVDKESSNQAPVSSITISDTTVSEL